MLDGALQQLLVLKKMARSAPPEFGGTSEGQSTKTTVSCSADGFHWKADSAHGEKVARYCFPDKREVTRRLMSPSSKHVGKSVRDAAEELVGEKRDGYRVDGTSSTLPDCGSTRSAVHGAHANTGNT